MPAIGDPFSGLRHAKSVLLVPLLPLDDRPADRLTQLSHIVAVARQLLGLVAVGQRQVQTVALQGLTSPLEIGPRQSADQPLAVAMMPDVLGLGDLKGLVEPAVGQRTFRLLDSQDQHDKAPSRCERR
jgi:hypothetical protein